MTNENNEPPIVVRVAQLTRDELQGLTSDQINDALAAGRLAEVMGGEAPIDFDATYAARQAAADQRTTVEQHEPEQPTPDQLTRADVRRMSPEAIAHAHGTGQLDHLLGIKPRN